MPQDKSAFDDQNFDKESLEKTIKDMTDPETGELKSYGQPVNEAKNPVTGGRVLKNVGVTEAEQKAYLASRPYKAERSSLHKGIFSKPGHVYLKVKYTWKDRQFLNVRQFPSKDLNQGVMNHLYDKMYEEILKQYNLR